MISLTPSLSSFFFFFFNDTATTEIYTLSLHDALPICELAARRGIRASRIAHGVPVGGELEYVDGGTLAHALAGRDRKSTRLNSSHLVISYAVFCLKKKKNSAVMSAHARHNSTGGWPTL